MTSEQRRLHYLQSMGIDGYYPRYQLSGAAVSVACEHIFDEECAFLADSIVVTPDAEPASNKEVHKGLNKQLNDQKQFDAKDASKALLPDKQVPAAVGLLAKDLADSKKRRNILNAKQSTNQLENEKDKLYSPESQPQAITFNLGVWRIGDELLVVDTRQPNSALPVEKLLLNIVRALGYDLPRLPAVTQLRWPSIDGASSGDEKSAKEMVEAFLIAENNKKPFSQILLMGNNAAKFALPNKKKNNETNLFNFNALVSQAFEIDTTDIKASAIVVPSLTVLLQKPKFKSITWQSIQSFRL